MKTNKSSYWIAQGFVAVIFLCHIAIILMTGCGTHPRTEQTIYRVTLYQDGKLLRLWDTSDTPETCNNAIRFHDLTTGTLVNITGTVVVEHETWFATNLSEGTDTSKTAH